MNTTAVRLLLLSGIALITVSCGESSDRGAESTGAGGADTSSPPVAELAPAAEPAAPDTVTTTTDCEPSGDLQYLCGLQNAEDLVAIGASQWLIASGMNGALAGSDAPAPGHIYLIDHVAKTFEEWFPGATPAFAPDTAVFGNCPAPINPANFSAHGLALKENSPGHYRLYVTSHGEREAVEVFDIDASGAKPAIAWAGCVTLPNTIWPNSVAILGDGGFVVTKFMDPGNPNAFAEIQQGNISGQVFEWHPGGEVTAIAGTELSGANGIALSADDRWMYVAAFGGHLVAKFDRAADPITKETVAVGVTPDNLRWTPDGTLYTVGGNYVAPADCASPPCETGWSVYEIDTGTWTAARVTGVDQTATLRGASAAIAVGNEIWIGTYSGDRIGYLPKPP